jgi:hypothetical protein
MLPETVKESLVSALEADRQAARNVAVQWFEDAPHNDVDLAKGDGQTTLRSCGFTAVFEHGEGGYESQGTASLNFVYDGEEYILRSLAVPFEPVAHAVGAEGSVRFPPS